MKNNNENLFGDNLLKMRLNRNLSKKELAEKLLITEQMLGAIENNKRGKLPEWFYLLGETLNCSYDTLIKGVEKYDSEIIYINKCINIERTICFSMSQESMEKVAFSKAFLDNAGIKNYSSIVYIKYDIDNMYPTIKSNDDVFIDTKQKEVIDNQIYAIQEDNRIKIKRLFRASPFNQEITVTSDNKDARSYPDYPLTPKQANELIYGRVVYFGRSGDKI